MIFQKDFNFSDWMTYESKTPIKMAFGNCCWNMKETENIGSLQFIAPSRRKRHNVENLFNITLSENLFYIDEKVIYKPHAYIFERTFKNNKRKAKLIFPPKRQGCILYIDYNRSVEINSQILLRTWDYDDIRKAELLYPNFNIKTNSFSFRKGDFYIEIGIYFNNLKSIEYTKGWHEARLGYRASGPYFIVFGFGLTRSEARRERERLYKSYKEIEKQTKNWWNDYFKSCPLVVLERDIVYLNKISQKRHRIRRDEFLKRQLWHYYIALAAIIDVKWCKATPIQSGDRYYFNVVATNDNSFGAMLLSLTNKSYYARAHFINFLKYLMDSKGKLHWILRYSGKVSSYILMHGVPSFLQAIGHYIRCTGDKSIMDEKIGKLTVWEKMKLYQRRLRPLRDSNNDGLIEWNHLFETGEDNKDAPFFKKKGLLEWMKEYESCQSTITRLSFYRKNICPTTALNEQAFHLWALEEMCYLARLKGGNSNIYRKEINEILRILYSRHWNKYTKFYHDYDVRAKRLWHAKNLDAFYIMYFEKNKKRLKWLIKHLEDPNEFNLTLLPTLARDDEHFDPLSYWAGAAWSREHGFVAIALDKQGMKKLSFQWIARAICCGKGPIIPEVMDPLCDPAKQHGPVSCMVMSSINQVVLLDICGLKTWLPPLKLERDSNLPVKIIQIDKKMI